MSIKRKDNKGNILQKGESQRKGGLYQYRYTDMHNTRQTVYAPDLAELRRKEAEIQRQMLDGIDYAAGKISVNELIQRYLGLKQGVATQTKKWYENMWKPRQNDKFCHKAINIVKPSDIKQWFIQLNRQGLAYSSINGLKAILTPAFQMAYDEDIIRKNPCMFKLADVVSNNKKEKFALTDEQQRLWLDFIRNDTTYGKYYDMFVILLGTGLRVSEFCGLTQKDIDFANRRISVNHQLLQIAGQGYKIEKPKTEKGVRYIPMTNEVYTSLQNALANRPKVKQEAIIEGYSGFVFINQNGNPYERNFMGKLTSRILKKYNGLHVEQLPKITPHILRHTFCSNMANADMDIKTLQYIMGHSKISVTMEVYTHTNFERVAKQMAKVVNFQAATQTKTAQ